MEPTVERAFREWWERVHGKVLTVDWDEAVTIEHGIFVAGWEAHEVESLE